MDERKVLKVFREKKSFLVTTHVNPDPDAVASQLALGVFLRAQKKRVAFINDDDLPERFLFLPGAKSIRKASPLMKGNFEVLVILDCGEIERIGGVERFISENTIIVNIDHHVTNTMFGHVNLVAPAASSSCEVLADLFEQARFPLNQQAAFLLYLGIMTDTGSFRYDNTSSHTHEIVGRLLKFKIPVSELYRKMYESVPLHDLKHFTRIVDAFDVLYDGKVVSVELRKGVLKKFSQDFDLRDKIFRYLRAIKGVEVLVILTEHEKTRTRVNLRSQHHVNVARLAAIFGGGGHRRASGCLVPGGLAEAREKILKEIEKVI